MTITIIHKEKSSENERPRSTCNFNTQSLEKYPNGTLFMHDLDKDWDDQEQPTAFRLFKVGKGKWLRRGVQESKRAPCGHHRIGNICLEFAEPIGKHDLPFNASTISRLDLDFPVGGKTVIFGGPYLADSKPRVTFSAENHGNVDDSNDFRARRRTRARSCAPSRLTGARTTNFPEEHPSEVSLPTSGAESTNEAKISEIDVSDNNTGAESTNEVKISEIDDSENNTGAESTLETEDDSDRLSTTATIASSRSSVKTEFSVKSFPGAKKAHPKIPKFKFDPNFKTKPLTDKQFSKCISDLNISGKSQRYKAVLNNDIGWYYENKDNKVKKNNYHDMKPDDILRQAEDRKKKFTKKLKTGYVPGRVLKK